MFYRVVATRAERSAQSCQGGLAMEAFLGDEVVDPAPVRQADRCGRSNTSVLRLELLHTSKALFERDCDALAHGQTPANAMRVGIGRVGKEVAPNLFHLYFEKISAAHASLQTNAFAHVPTACA